MNRVCSPLISEEETVGWHHQLNARESGQTLGDGEGQGSLVSCSPWGCEESDTTKLRWPGLLILMSFSGLFNLASGEFLAAPPMISNCWNPAFGTRGRSGKLESCLKERGERRVPVPGRSIASSKGPAQVQVLDVVWPAY